MILDGNEEGRRYRLAAAMELLQACQEMGERVDPQTALDVLATKEAELEQEAARMLRLVGPQPVASEEDIRDAHALIAAARILWDVAGVMQMRKKPGRYLRQVLKARDIIFEEVVNPILLTMEKGEKTLPVRQAIEWYYTLWGPEHRQLMEAVLASTIAGKPPKREIREAAMYLRDRFTPTQEQDQLKQQQRAAAD